jgi:hypothetical protein
MQCTPAFTDLDGDSLYDMIIGLDDGMLSHYAQDATGSTSFSLISENFNDIDVDWGAKPSFTSFLDDGLLDMIIGASDGALYHYKQDVTGGATFSLVSEDFQGIVVEGYSSLAFADINGDGLEDLIMGMSNGGLRYFQRNDETDIKQESLDPVSLETISNHPNPFSVYTHIQYSLHKRSKVRIIIYNMLGQKVRLLENSYKNPGSYSLQWNGTDEQEHSLPSGFYICSIQAEACRKSIKLLFIK